MADAPKKPTPIPADHQLARTDAPTPVQPIPPVNAGRGESGYGESGHGGGGHGGGGYGGGHGGDEGVPKDLKAPSGGTIAVVAGAFVVLLIAIFFVGWIPGHREEVKTREEAIQESKAKPVAQWCKPVPSNGESDVTLPCNVTAYQHTALFTQANGYLIDLCGHDIGSKVKKGDVLAVVAMPVVDAQVTQANAAKEQAIANVNQAVANQQLAKVTYDRYLEAQKHDPHSVTQEDVDTNKAKLDVADAALVQAKANVDAADASLKQNLATQSFEKILAPYDGTITTRNYFVGQLLLATQVAPGQEVFDIEEDDRMRVFVNVPQTYANNVVIGQEATLVIQNFPGREFKGKVALTSASVDPNSRTLLVQVDFDNKDGKLVANEYGQLKLPVSAQAPVLRIPSSGLIFNDKGLTVDTITDGDRIHVNHVKVGRDFGVDLEITEGLKVGDHVVLNPGERFAEGVEIEPREQPGAVGPAAVGTLPAATQPAHEPGSAMPASTQPILSDRRQ